MKEKIKIRETKIEDITQILKVEKEAWGEKEAASKEMFESRIKTFPEGTLVAEIDKEIIGVVSTEIVNYDPQKDSYTWYEITDNGFIRNSHKSSGNTIYGVDMSVSPSYQRLGVGTRLLESIGKLAIRYNVKQGMLGGRIPQYYKYAGKIKVEDYINSGLDPEIAFYKKAGLGIVKIIPNYYKDPESFNYGILLLWKNPFYNKWYKWLAAKLFKI